MSEQAQPQQYDRDDRIPVVVRRDPKEGTYKVALAGVDLEKHLLHDGVRIAFEAVGDGPAEPTITLVFAPGATELDLDAPLIAYLRAQDAAQQKPKIVNHAAGCKDPSRCPGCR